MHWINPVISFSVCLCVCEQTGCQTITSTVLCRFSPNFACGSEMWLLRCQNSSPMHSCYSATSICWKACGVGVIASQQRRQTRSGYGTQWCYVAPQWKSDVWQICQLLHLTVVEDSECCTTYFTYLWDRRNNWTLAFHCGPPFRGSNTTKKASIRWQDTVPPNSGYWQTSELNAG